MFIPPIFITPYIGETVLNVDTFRDCSYFASYRLFLIRKDYGFGLLSHLSPACPKPKNSTTQLYILNGSNPIKYKLRVQLFTVARSFLCLCKPQISN